MDAVSPKEAKSRNMRAVRGKDTKPELEVRRAAHGLGLRFRLFRRDLPGRPDLTFPKRRTVIFVNGCFWHQHHDCRKSAIPKSNVEFWATKLEKNVLRDQRNFEELQRQGWRVVVVWECDLARFGAAKIVRDVFKIAPASRAKPAKPR
jgi:DNA mismatch endonuclease, patch repair protein